MEIPPWLKLNLGSFVKNLNLSNSLNIQKEHKNTSVQQKANVTYNAPVYNIGIGDPSDLLNKRQFSDKSMLEVYQNGLKILNLTEGQIDECGIFFNKFYKRKDNNITRNALTMMQGAVFAVGTKDLNNPEWKEHCASSLREIFHEWNGDGMSSDFAKFYKKDKKLSQNEKNIFKIFKNRYEYFSGVDHHNASKVLYSLIAIKGDNTIKLEYCYTDEVFIEGIKDFFYDCLLIMRLVDKEL